MLTVLNRSAPNYAITRLKRLRARFKSPILNAGPTRKQGDMNYTTIVSKHQHLRKAKHGLQRQSF